MNRRISAVWLAVLGFVSGCSTLPEHAPPDPAASRLTLEEADNLWTPSILQDNTMAGMSGMSGMAGMQGMSGMAGMSGMVGDKADLWAHISNGYSLLPTLEHPDITRTIQEFSEYRRYFDQIGEQARPYLHYIVQELERRGMPMELALLPAIESGFRPSAVSPAKAVGLWQFTPGTASHFGLKNTRWYDGRRDLVASTDAALNYLQKLYEFFNGDWLNAIAAYNCGEGTVQKAMQKNLAEGKPTDYWSLDLPEETRQFVPRLMAVSAIVADPEQYGIDLPSIANQPYLTPVQVGAQIDLSVAANLAGVSPHDIKQLNPGLTRGATAPDGPHELLVPIDKADAFRQRLTQVSRDKLMPVALAEEDDTDDAPAIAKHRIRKGDTLARIATRYGTTVEALRKLNGTRDTRALRIGKELRVPAKATAQARKQDTPRKALAAAKPATRAHTIKSGETLGHIAARYDVTVEALCRANGITPKTRLALGKSLSIPAAATPAKPSGKPGKSREVLHTVKNGDTLWNIASAYKVSVQDLADWNRIAPKTTLRLGQTLKIQRSDKM